MSALQRLKERKLVQWMLAYLAGAWLLIEVFSTLREELDWSSWLFPILVGALAVGFVVTLVLAWYHGEQGRQRVSGPELLIIGGILGVAALLTPLVFGSDQAAVPQELAVPADSTSAPAASRGPTIAVLPLRNLSGVPEDEPFVVGIYEEFLTQLYKVRSLDTKSPQSALAYRDSDKTLPAIAEELGVRYLVQGSVRRGGETIRMSVNLFDARTDRRLWGDNYEGRYTAETMLEFQRKIAIDVATQLGAEILPGERTQLAVDAPESLMAYEQYLDGLYDFRAGTLTVGPDRVEAFRRARDALQEVTATEPEWAPAWAALGRVYHFLASFVEPSVNYTLSREAVDRAIALDPDHAPAWASLGYVLHNWELDFEGAEAAYQEAERLGWRASWGYAILLNTWGGRYAEAIDAYKRAASFNRSHSIQWQLAQAYTCAGDYDAAIELMEGLLRAGAPGSPAVSLYLGYSYLKAGYPEEGLARVPETRDSGKALLYALADSTERAEALLEVLQQGGIFEAAAAVSLGDPGRALDYLETAVDQDPRRLLFVQCFEELRSLEGDPRYEAVLDRVGFPPREGERE